MKRRLVQTGNLVLELFLSKMKLLSCVRLFATPWTIQARILEWVAFPFSRGSSQPRDRTQVSRIAGGFFLPAEPPGKPKNTGVDSLSVLQWIFPAQELNWGLLHCRWILYQLSYMGSPFLSKPMFSFWLMNIVFRIVLCWPNKNYPIFKNHILKCRSWKKRNLRSREERSRWTMFGFQDTEKKKKKWKCSRSIVLTTVALHAPLSMEFSRQDTGVGSHSFLQGTFLTQGSNLGLLCCRQIL